MLQIFCMRLLNKHRWIVRGRKLRVRLKAILLLYSLKREIEKNIGFRKRNKC